MMDGPGGARDPRFGNPYAMGLEAPADMYGGGSLRGGLQACSGLQRGLKRPGSDSCYDERPVSSQSMGLEHCPMPDIADDGYASLQPKKSPPSNGKKTKGRVKIKMEYIDNKLRRYTTFSKRKTGIMKKAYELSTLTGTQVMLLVASETGHVYTFATRKLQPMITSDSGKRLIQTCLNSPDPPSGAPVGDQRMSATGFEETELTYNIVDDEVKGERSPMSSGESCDESGSEPESPSDKYSAPPRAHRAPSDWCKPDSPERDDFKREHAVSTSSDDLPQSQPAHRANKDQQQHGQHAPHGLPAALASFVPGGGGAGAGGSGAYRHVTGLEGLGLGGLPMGYPHGIILGLTNQNADGSAGGSQPQFITIPLSMAMAAAAAGAGVAAGAGEAGAGSSDELQDLSTGARK